MRRFSSMVSNIEEFAADLAAICAHTPVAQGRPLRWTVIANPTAGGFTIRSRWRQHQQVLRSFAGEAQARTSRQENASPSTVAREMDYGNGRLGAFGLIPTRGVGDAATIVRALVDEARAFSPRDKAEPAPFYLVVTAGGDGTSLEALTALFHAPANIRSRFAILRLPMGTGNDGADARELADALSLIARPSRIEYARAIRLRTSRPEVGPFLAFNILSIGLDAFVTHMTNRMKGKLPGDSYKLWVDIATLFYDKIYPVGPMAVSARPAGKETMPPFREELLLVAFGATGRRTYGSNKLILPDDRNVCAVVQMPLLRKIALKTLFTTGRHANLAEAKLFNAESVEIQYDRRILVQMDGEAALLRPEDFPVTIELTEPAIPTLKLV